MAEVKTMNTSKSEDTDVNQKVIKPVVSSSSEIKIKKKSLWNKFIDAMFSKDGQDIGDYILVEVIVPVLQGAIIDTVNNFFNLRFYGSGAGRPARATGGTKPAYGSMYTGRNPVPQNQNSQRITYDQITFPTRDAAYAALLELQDAIARYGKAYVAYLFEAARLTPSHVDYNFGWSDLSNLGMTDILRCPQGWYINLPKPMAVEN